MWLRRLRKSNASSADTGGIRENPNHRDNAPTAGEEHGMKDRVMTTERRNITTAIEVIPLKLARLDHYQRDPKSQRVASMAHNWDDLLLGVPHVSRRNGEFWVIDGGHRIAAMMRNGETEVRVLVYTGLTFEQESEMFLGLNESKPITPIDRLKAEYDAKFPDAIKLVNLMHSFDVRLAGIDYAGLANKTYKGKYTNAAATLKRLYKQGVLAETLEVIDSVWADSEGAFDGVVMDGVGHLLYRLGDDIDRRRLRSVMSTRHPASLKRDSSVYQSSYSRSKAYAAVLANWYNHRKQNGRLSIEKVIENL